MLFVFPDLCGKGVFWGWLISRMSILVVAANVGTLGTGELLLSRMRHLERLVELRAPQVVAFHFQELGGETKDVASIEQLRRALRSSSVFVDFVGSGLLCNADPQHDFSALGSAFFVRKSFCESVRVLDRKLDELVALDSFASQTEEARFLSFCRSERLAGSRKGYLLVSFSISGHLIDFINVHFPADLDNVQAAASVPSIYAAMRAECCRVSLERCAVSLASKSVVAGDFNFRLDLKPLWEGHRSPTTDRLEPKMFRCVFVDEAIARGTSSTALAQWDRELARLNTAIAPLHLCEPDRKFAPTYCLRDGEILYDTKRCPAWPDRVLITPALKDTLNSAVPLVYDALNWSCDHHVVYLALEVSPLVASEKRMRHAPEPELALGRLIVDSDMDPRRRRGVWNASTFLAVGLIIATGVFLYSRVK